MELPRCRETATGLRIDVRVMPRSPRNTIAGVRAGRLLIRVTAPPVEGAANEAVTRLLAKSLAVSGRELHIVSGDAGRNKVVEIRGLNRDTAERRLSAILT